MSEKLEVVRDGRMFAVKVTYYSGYVEHKRGFSSEIVAEAWIANRRTEIAACIGREKRASPIPGKPVLERDTKS
jgi:hypothetical protein